MTPIRPARVHVHLAGVLPEKFRIPHDAEYFALSRHFRDSLSREQWDMSFKLDVLDGNRHTAETDAYVEELCRPMPLMAPAIRCVAWHLIEQKLADRGTCCAHPWEADASA